MNHEDPLPAMPMGTEKQQLQKKKEKKKTIYTKYEPIIKHLLKESLSILLYKYTPWPAPVPHLPFHIWQR